MEDSSEEHAVQAVMEARNESDLKGDLDELAKKIEG